MTDPVYPIFLYRFHVEFQSEQEPDVQLAQGAFSECTGLEATMEPKVIKAGGVNFGSPQRAGPVTFATVILKRGMTNSRDLWKWFSHVSEAGRYAHRLNVKIKVFSPTAAAGTGPSPSPLFTIRLARALPIKFKCGDLNARATEIGIEELHLAHEGLSFLAPGPSQ